MNENQTDSQMNQSANTPDMGKPEEGKGTMVGSIIIIIIIILGAVYLFYNRAEAPEITDETATEEESAITTEETTGSDELTDIESDINIVNQDVTEQVDTIETELE